MSSDPLTTLGTADRNRLEALLVEFDLGWGPDRLAGFVERLPSAGGLRAAGLRELVRIDRERQARLGRPLGLDEYAGRYPELLETGAGLAALAPTGDAPTPHLPARAGPPAVPEVFGRYRVVRPLGRGGMGSVYLARDTELDRLVALKVPHFRPDDPGAAERFAREARAAATIDHPHVCRVYDVGRIDGTPFLTMAFVDGRTLADEARAAPLAPRRAAEVVRDAARGMAEAHRMGVVHRDLKPGNILMGPDGRPVVTDFGLARRDADDLRLTASGTVLGTPLYMAPEQVAGDTDRVGPASDVYALGVVLYELLAGRPPFGMDRTQVMAGALSKDPPPPSGVRPGLDPRLDAVVLRAMAKRPDDRFTMTQLADALDAWLKDDAPRPPRRLARPLIAAAVVVAILGLLLPLAVKRGWLGAGPPPNPDGGPKDDQVNKNGQVRKDDPVVLPTVAASQAIPEGQRLIAVGFSPDGRELYTATAVGEVQVAIRRWDVATRRDLSGDVKPEKHEWATFAPGGRRFVMGGGGQYAELAAVASGDTEYKFETGPHGKVAAVTRDGLRVIVGFQETSGKLHWARVWEAESGRVLGGYSGHEDDIRAVALSDDGRWAYSVSPDREALCRVGAAEPVYTAPKPTARCADFLPGSDRLLIGSQHGDLRVYSATANAQLVRFDGQHDDAVTCLAVSPDGRFAVSGSVDRTVRVWDVATGKERWKLDGHTGPVTGVAFSPDGRRVASCAADHTWRVWELPK
jgi:hypothetical protein